MKYLKTYENLSSYNINDIILIEYWFNDMITPVKIKGKIGNKYIISHNIKESQIQNAPDEKISKSQILDHYNESYNNPTGFDNNTDLKTWNFPIGKTGKRMKIPGELIDMKDDTENTRMLTGEDTSDDVIDVADYIELGKKHITDPNYPNKTYYQKIKIKRDKKR